MLLQNPEFINEYCPIIGIQNNLICQFVQTGQNWFTVETILKLQTHHCLLYSVVDRALASTGCTAKESIG